MPSFARLACLPHARGGVSNKRRMAAGARQSSPRPWGCFRCIFISYTASQVFPTPVGVFLPLSRPSGIPPRLPHARGGVSIWARGFIRVSASSPRPWGCFLSRHLFGGQRLVFPTPVGVFLKRIAIMSYINCLPHARGGVSKWRGENSPQAVSSPRPWGCFSKGSQHESFQFVFPTPVGVFPAFTR